MRGYEFTKCRSADGSLATKVVTRLPDGTVGKTQYGRGFLWNYEPLVAAGNNALAELLVRLAPQHDTMLVMGEPVAGLDIKKPHRRLFASITPDENTLQPVDRACIVLDLDDIPVLEPLGDGDKRDGAAEHVRDRLLPPEFRGIECTVSASRGMTDPVPPALHAFVLAGIMGDRVQIDVHRYDSDVRAINHRVITAEHEAHGDWRVLLEATLGGPHSFFIPLTKAIGLAARSDDTEQDVVAFTRALLAERAGPGRRAEYDEGWIKRTLRSFNRRDADRQKRIDSLRSGLFHEPRKDNSNA